MTSSSRRGDGHDADTSGFTIVEVSISTVLLIVGVLGFVGALLASQVMMRSTKESNRANALMITTMEEFRRECIRDFQVALGQFAGITTFRRTIEYNPDGKPVDIDHIKRETTVSPNQTNGGVAAQIRARSGSEATGPVNEAQLNSDLTTARNEAEQAKTEADLAEQAVMLAPVGVDPTALQADLDAKRAIQAEKEAEVARLEAQEVALNDAKNADTTGGSPTTSAASVLRQQIIAEYRLGVITDIEAKAKWLAEGDGSPLVINGDGSIESANQIQFADGSSATETFQGAADGSSTTTRSRTLIDGTSQNVIQTFSPTETVVTTQQVAPTGLVQTVVSTTRKVNPSIPVPSIVDMDLLFHVGAEAEMQVFVVVDETSINPPIDLNGDGDTADTNVSINECVAAVLRVVVEWNGANGRRQVECITILAKGEAR